MIQNYDIHGISFEFRNVQPMQQRDLNHDILLAGEHKCLFAVS